MHPSMRGHYGHHSHPSMRHPRYPMDPSGRFPMHPGMHPRMGFPGMQHPGMQHPGLGQMGSQRMRFQGDQSGMGNPQMGPGANYYSEQLRQKALASTMGAPNGQNMSPMGGPPGMGGPGMPGPGQNGPTGNFNQRFPNQPPGGDQMMTPNGNFNNQNSNGPLRPNGPNPGPPGSGPPMNQSDPFGQPNTPTSIGGGPTPNPTNGGNSYPPANSPGAFNQNGPGKLAPKCTAKLTNQN